MTDREHIIAKVLEHGKAYIPGWVPKELPLGQVGDCYDVCLLVALKFPELKYVEGVARNPLTGEWILHAWITNEEGEAAADLTWRMEHKETKEIHPVPTDYFGIEMDTELVVDFVVATEYKGVLANYWRDPEKGRKILGFSLDD